MGVRIGLAYNLKPQAAAIAGGDFASPVDRNTALRALRTDLDQPDLYAEWDEPGTIDAIERALRPLGQVIRLEADASFPQKLADAQAAHRPLTAGDAVTVRISGIGELTTHFIAPTEASA